METKICGRCKLKKPLSEFFRHKRDGYQARCKSCKRECYKEEYKRLQAKGYFVKRWKEYGQRLEVRERRLKRLKQYRKDPRVRIKNLARWYTNHQIRTGKLNREPCALCDIEPSEAHHLDYNQPLLIVWLCSNCHRKFHLKEGKE